MKISAAFCVLLCLAHLKSHFRFVLYALEERYIVTAASDIYFCKHPHNVVALLLLAQLLDSSRNISSDDLFVRVWDSESDNSRE